MPSQVIGIILTAGAVLLIAYWIVSAEWRQKRKRATRDGIIERQTRSRHVPDYDENGQNH